MSWYLDHGMRNGRERLSDTVSLLHSALAPVEHLFESVLVTGLSGVIPGAIYAHSHNKHLVVLRKKITEETLDSPHGSLVEGPDESMCTPWIMIDDFIYSGATYRRLLHAGQAWFGAPHRDPLAFVIYGRDQGAKGATLRNYPYHVVLHAGRRVNPSTLARIRTRVQKFELKPQPKE